MRWIFLNSFIPLQWHFVGDTKRCVASSARPGWQLMEWCLSAEGQHDLVDRISSGGHFVQRVANLLTWKFGREGGDGGQASYTTAILCEDQMCGALLTLFLSCIFLFFPHSFWQPHCSYILKVFPSQAQSVSWCTLARGWLFFYVLKRLPVELAYRMFINKVELGARADWGS